MNRNHLFALLAFAVLAAYLGVFAFRVPRPDLVIVIAISIALVIYDLWTELRPERR